MKRDWSRGFISYICFVVLFLSCAAAAGTGAWADAAGERPKPAVAQPRFMTDRLQEGRLCVRAQVYPANMERDMNMILVVAFYDQAALCGINSQTQHVTTEDTEIDFLETSLDIPYREDYTDCEARAFVWDSVSEMTPLTVLNQLTKDTALTYDSVDPIIKTGKYENDIVGRSDGSFDLIYAGEDEMVQFSYEPGNDPLESLRISVNQNTEIRLLGSEMVFSFQGGKQKRSDLTAVILKNEIKNNRVVSQVQYRTTGAAALEVAVVEYAVGILGKTLSVDISSDTPILKYNYPLENMEQAVSVPYMPEFVNTLLHQNIFLSLFADWKNSDASYLDASGFTYSRLTDQTVRSCEERLLLTVSSDLEEVFPTIPNERSPYRDEIGKKMIIDYWGHAMPRMSFAYMEQFASALYDYGMRDVIFLRHVWQRDGYDTNIPATMPSNAVCGGDEILTQIGQHMGQRGWLFGLHTNYTDYSSTYENFNEDHLLLLSNGKLRPGGMLGTPEPVQNYLLKPMYYQDYINQYEPEIKAKYQTSASFVDVFGARSVGRDTDADASVIGAGMFRTVDAYAKGAMEQMQEIHQGPVFSEGGADMARTSGIIDGMEAQLGENTRVMPNFDLRKLFPLSLNHGMGYYSRWNENQRTDHARERAVLDKYRAQQLAYGHQAFVEDRLPTELMSEVLKEYYFMLPIQKQYALSKIEKISYINPDGQELNVSEAVRDDYFNDPKRDRLKLEYENGCMIYINNQPDLWEVEGRCLPQYGFTVRRGDFSGGTLLSDGKYSDYMVSEQQVYFEPRTLRYWYNICEAAPVLEEIKIDGERIAMGFRWRINGMLPQDATHVVCHILNPDGSIAAVADHSIPPAMLAMQCGEQDLETSFSSKELKVGTVYQIALAVYNVNTGQRYYLQGAQNDQSMVIAGQFRLRSADGLEIVPYMQDRANPMGEAVDFGAVCANNAFTAKKTDDSWTLTVLPKYAPLILTFSQAELTYAEAVDKDGRILCRIPAEEADGKQRLILDELEADRYQLYGSIQWTED